MTDSALTNDDASLEHYVQNGDVTAMQKHLSRIGDAYKPTYIARLIEEKKKALAEMEYEIQHCIVQDWSPVLLALALLVIGPIAGASRGELWDWLIITPIVSLLFVLLSMCRPLKRRVINKHAKVISVLAVYCVRYGDDDQMKPSQGV